MKKGKLVIIDGNALIHRAYHALPLLTTKKGELTNAIYGFLLVFLKAIREFQPDYIAACFDLPAPTFRHKKFPSYKAQRPKTPEELTEQIPKIKRVLEAFSVSIFEKQGFEADDLIGTIAKSMEASEVETIILSGDLDTLQIVDKNTKVYTLRKGVKDTILYDEERVKVRYQIPPSRLPDFKALKGDPSDNIPGVPGVGDKTASQLLREFGSLENLYKEIEQGSQRAKKIRPRIKEVLLKTKDQAFFSKMLAQIRYDVPLDFNLKKCKWRDYDREEVVKILKEFEFFGLINRLALLKSEPGDGQKRLSI